MRKKEKERDRASKQAIQRGIRELRKIGFLLSSVARTYYVPIAIFGFSRQYGRLAVAALRDGTKVMVLAIGPHVGSSSSRWYPYKADIKHRPVPLREDMRPDEEIKLDKICDDPCVWGPRDSMCDFTIGTPIHLFWDNLHKKEDNLLRRMK